MLFRISVLVGVAVLLITAGTFAAASLLDATTERTAAVEAEKRADYDSALLHYENIFDSCITDATLRAELREKFKALRPKVLPNTDPANAGVWKSRAYIFRTLDFTWKDKEGKDHHATYTFRDDEIEAIKAAMQGFADRVWKHSWGNLRIEYDVKVIDEPLTSLDGEDSFWPGPGSCMKYFDDLKYGEVDNIFVYAKVRGDKDKGEESEEIPLMLLAGALGVYSDTKGAAYIGCNSGGGWCMDPSGEVQWHEWLHSVQWTLEVHQCYPPGLMASSDSGRKEGQTGGDPCFRLKESEKNWLPFYVHIMEEHATRKMWRELSIRNKPNNPWLSLYCQNFLVCGPFDIKDKPNQGLDIPFIDETDPLKSTDVKWKAITTSGRNLDFFQAFEPSEYKLAYALIVVKSDKDQLAQVRLGSDDGCKLFQNGRAILYAPVLRGADTDQNIVDVQLTKGENIFLLKVANAGGDWAAIFRITDLHGNPLKGIEYVKPK
ncbi:MAG TPA: hypothetical protein PLZ21_00670 [Armatimonadota bacterium]|nr:hypothetical protein [Armatimonadota bacterium]